MKQEYIEKIKQLGLPDNLTSAAIDSLTERFLVQPEKAAINLGDSKIGGYPHLPTGVEYPQEDNYYYEFVAQINLSDLKDHNMTGLPGKGILYFFIGDDFNTGNVPAKVFVITSELDELIVKAPPAHKKSRCESFSSRTAKTELQLRLTKSYTIDQYLLDKIINWLQEQPSKSTATDPEQFYTLDQLGGYTTTWGGGEASWSAYLAKKRLQGLYWLTLDHQLELLKKENQDIKAFLTGKVATAIADHKELLEKQEKNLPIYSYWEKELDDLYYAQSQLDEFADHLTEHKSAAKNWKMLLSLSSYSEAAISFGDGKMEFFVEEDEMKNQRFDNVFCHIYN